MVNKRTTSKSTNGQVRNRRSQAQGAARTPLLPLGVNNQSTMPSQTGSYTYSAEEVISVVNVASGSTTGQTIFNGLITPKSCRRLGVLANAWQRIDWIRASIHLVALNGSVVQSGYTMGFIEDPEAKVPTDTKELIPFLTALRSTTVRQNWVESTAGVQVGMPDKPEMYTALGSDVRRYSPGRLVIALAGDVGAQATYQLMLRYTVRLYVPFATTEVAPPSLGHAIREYTKTANALNVTGEGLIPIYSPSAVGPFYQLKAGFWTFDSADQGRVRYFPPGTEVRIIRSRDDDTEATRYRISTPTLASAVGSYIWRRTNTGSPMEVLKGDGMETGVTY
nr:MAG: putative coat protein [Tombusviridae sp.]